MGTSKKKEEKRKKKVILWVFEIESRFLGSFSSILGIEVQRTVVAPDQKTFDNVQKALKLSRKEGREEREEIKEREEREEGGEREEREESAVTTSDGSFASRVVFSSVASAIFNRSFQARVIHPPPAKSRPRKSSFHFKIWNNKQQQQQQQQSLTYKTGEGRM